MIKISCEDTTLVLNDIQSFQRAINLFQKFGTCSGLKRNLDKTEIILLDSAKQKNWDFPNEIKSLKFYNKAFKTLRIWFSSDSQLSSDMNYNDRLKEAEKLLFIWRSRQMSLEKGK